MNNLYILDNNLKTIARCDTNHLETVKTNKDHTLIYFDNPQRCMLMKKRIPNCLVSADDILIIDNNTYKILINF